MQAPCWRRDLPCLRRGVPYWRRGVPYLYLCHYTVSLPECTVLAVDLVMDLVETTIFLPYIFSSFLLFVLFSGLSSMLMFFKSKKCFLIGIRISPGSTGLYCVDVTVTPGSAVSAPGCAGSTVFTPVWCQGLSCRYRGLSCWYRGVPGSTVFVPGWRRGLPCWHRGNAGVCRVYAGWRSSRRPSMRFYIYTVGQKAVWQQLFKPKFRLN